MTQPTKPTTNHREDCTISNPCLDCRKFMEKPPTPTLREADDAFRDATFRIINGWDRKHLLELAKRWVAAARASALEEAAAIARRRADARGLHGHAMRHPEGEAERKQTPAARRHKAVELALRQAETEIRALKEAGDGE